MNTFSKVFAAGALSVFALSGQAFADNENSAFSQSVREHTYGVQAPVGNYGYAAGSNFVSSVAHQDDLSVRNVSALDRATKAQLLDQSNSASVQGLQASIKKNAALVNAFNGRDISVSNVIGTIKGSNGSTTYIVR